MNRRGYLASNSTKRYCIWA